ncbi:phytanoyl-CoA dioxygenase family protein (plasmid) [Paenibacillus thiaminolyticus]|uniref:phytanoyl-CoA dioxygenase family protein n=1 Tax=Paenibacillus thiaminolyticus TaxID=49283 RepID=UPI002330287C|nr:phytanoyl-CoA dioxygenase family protein [Paenibacillus thiaminolyticus]WCF11610.1 phytanoyl-CoA dioxygenase family protein [Paenibacillus thiaminolyticus]
MKGYKGFVNEFDLLKSIINLIAKSAPRSSYSPLSLGEYSFYFDNLLAENEVRLINEQIDSMNWLPVGIDGILKNYKENDDIGSWRATCYEPELAEALWNRIKSAFPSIRVMNEMSPTDWDGSYEWEPIGINPAFRFIRYNKNELLIPHYDAPYIQDYNIRSLSTLVLYLSDNQNSGCTRFLRDKQIELPLSERNYDDWTEEASEDFVLFKVSPSKGDALIFDHRILHDSERMKDDQVKTIIRTDIMYRRIM